MKEINPSTERQVYNTNYKLYTTRCVAIATFIGGPLAGFYLISVNFENLNKLDLAQKAFILGISISLLLFTALIILPEQITNIIPKSILPIINSMLLGQYADAQQGSDIKNHLKSGGKKYSGWRAAAIGIECMLLTLLYCFVIALLVKKSP